MRLDHQSRMRRVAGIEGARRGFGDKKREGKQPEAPVHEAEVISLEERRQQTEREIDKIEALRDRIDSKIDVPKKPDNDSVQAKDILQGLHNRRLRA